MQRIKWKKPVHSMYISNTQNLSWTTASDPIFLLIKEIQSLFSWLVRDMA